MSLRKREREAAERQVLARLRGRMLSGIHGGHLNPGDRLPSYREVATETGVDLRAVGRIYEALEKEGLVEIRGKTGVYVAPQEHIGGAVLAETARWAISVLGAAWSRRIALPHFPEFIRRCTSTAQLRCLCIESTEDQLVSLCGELTDDFGLETKPFHADRLVAVGPTAERKLDAELRRTDILATTTFHAATVRRIAKQFDKPFVQIRLDPDSTRAVERHLERNDLTVVCIDPRFVERVRAVLGGQHPERIHPILVTNRAAIARLSPDQPVLFSRAARRQLEGMQLPPQLLPRHMPVVAPDSAAELIELIVRLNLETLRDEFRNRTV